MQVPPAEKDAVRAHVLPFLVWVVLLFGLGEPAGWKYAVRTIVGGVLLLALRPWRGYPSLRASHVPAACLAGAVTFALWVLPESQGLGWPESLQALYLRWGVLPLGRLPEATLPAPYDPGVCGWALTLVRLAGATLVIAVMEEFFWRGFLYRWLLAKDFLRVDPGTFHAGFFLAVAVLFGFEHDRWLAGLLAGLIYGVLFLRTRDLWAACLAHGLTNFLLGVYVLATGAYAFW